MHVFSILREIGKRLATFLLKSIFCVDKFGIRNVKIGVFSIDYTNQEQITYEIQLFLLIAKISLFYSLSAV